MKMKVFASFDEYVADQKPRNQRILRALRRFVRSVAPPLHEAVKWGNGCWIKGTGPIAYVYSAPDHVQFGFSRGATLKHPKGLLQGKGAFVRHIKVRQRAEIDERPFAALLRQAVRQGPATRAKS